MPPIYIYQEKRGVAFGIKEETFAADTLPFILGFVMLTLPTGKIPWLNPTTRLSYRINPNETGRILDCIVTPDYQGRGIARLMVQIAEGRMGVHRVKVIKGYAEPAVQGLWKKLGYRILPTNDIEKDLERP